MQKKNRLRNRVFLIAITSVLIALVLGRPVTSAVFQNVGSVLALKSLHSKSESGGIAQEAIQYLERASSLNPTRSTRLLGWVYAFRLGDTERAVDIWKRPGPRLDVISALRLGDNYFERDQHDLALTYWKLAGAGPLLVKRALVQLDIGQPDAARRLLLMAIRL